MASAAVPIANDHLVVIIKKILLVRLVVNRCKHKLELAGITKFTGKLISHHTPIGWATLRPGELLPAARSLRSGRGLAGQRALFLRSEFKQISNQHVRLVAGVVLQRGRLWAIENPVIPFPAEQA